MLDSRMVPPPFAGLPAFDTQPDGRFWCITTPDRGQPPALAAFALPHDEVRHETARYTSHVLMATDDSCIPGYRALAEAVRPLKSVPPVHKKINTFPDAKG